MVNLMNLAITSATVANESIRRISSYKKFACHVNKTFLSIATDLVQQSAIKFTWMTKLSSRVYD